MTTSQSPAVEKEPAIAAVQKVVKPATKAVVDAAAKPVVKAAPKAATKATPKVAPKSPKAASKTVTKPAAKPVVKPKAEKSPKVRKPKLVRDSFTMPKPEYLVLDELKLRAGKLAIPVKKTELIRAGIKALATMTDAAFLNALKAVPAIKTGRPAAH